VCDIVVEMNRGGNGGGERGRREEEEERGEEERESYWRQFNDAMVMTMGGGRAQGRGEDDE
jgi:hypothetical protein